MARVSRKKIRNFFTGPRLLPYITLSGRFTFRFLFIPCDSGFESNCEADSPLFLTFLVDLCLAKRRQPIKRHDVAFHSCLSSYLTKPFDSYHTQDAYLLSSAVLQHHIFVFSSS